MLFCPSSSGDEEEFGVGANRLSSLRWSAEAGDGGAKGGKLDGDLLDLSGSGRAGKGCVRACVEQKEPGAAIAAEDGFDTLAIEPAGCFDAIRAADSRDVGVDEAAEAVGYASSDARKTGAGRGEDDGGLGGAAEGFKGGGIGRVARLGEGFA